MQKKKKEAKKDLRKKRKNVSALSFFASTRDADSLSCGHFIVFRSRLKLVVLACRVAKRSRRRSGRRKRWSAPIRTRKCARVTTS